VTITRPATFDDHPFIVVTWSKSVRQHAMYANGMTREVAADLLPCSWNILVACHPEEPFVVLGWVIFRDSRTVAWTYVRPEVRGRGIARQLWHDAGIDRNATIEAPFRTRNMTGWRIKWRPWITLS
jgi:GNAT superfamily N-acetyltransferase